MINLIRKILKPNTDAFLTDVSGVVHVGASDGQERGTYAERGLYVLWVEPIPQVYERLLLNISGDRRQTALCSLVTDRDGQTVTLNVASNNGKSSSIFQLADHEKIWPDVSFIGAIEKTSVTLDTIMAGAAQNKYDALVLDVQGAELLVLRGAEQCLQNFRYVRCEAWNFEAYKGCCRLSDIVDHLTHRGFKLHKKRVVVKRGDMRCYDVVFKRTKEAT